MVEVTLELSQKQSLARDQLNDPQIVELYYGGAAGGGKTMLVCLWILEQLISYPGIRIAVGRKELTRLKQSTIVTLFNKAHPLLGIKRDAYTFQDQKGLITYRNGSSIQLLDLARQPSDPDFDTFGSLEMTHIVIEEVGEIVQKARDVLSARKNRYLNEEYGIVGKMVLTGNPSQNFTRDDYYEPYRKQGAGDSQKWQFGKVFIKGKEHTAYRGFVHSLVTDNPMADPNYIEDLRRLPTPERKRLLEGNWDYTDNDSLLFKAHVIDRAVISELQAGDKYMGVDLADKGKDKTVISLVENNVLIDQHEVSVSIDRESAISEQTALALIKYAQQNNVPAQNIAIDAVGIGVGVRDFLRSKGWYVKEYVAGSKGREGYKNLRAETFWDLSQGLDSGKYRIYSGLDTIDSLRKELLSIEYNVEDRVVSLQKKDKIKDMLGYSPDHADSACMAFYAANYKRTSVKIIF